jgi:Tol biopolymer transport system component
MTGRLTVIALVSGALCGLALTVQAQSRVGQYGDSEIFVVNVDGTAHRNLTRGKGPAQRVIRAVSPDGRTLAFDRLRRENDYGYWSIVLLPTGGGLAHPLIRLPGVSASRADWSRDGKLIAYEMCCDEHMVGVVRSDGRGGTWIPDGSEPTWLRRKQLSFLKDVSDFAGGIATTHADGTGRRVLVRAGDVSLSYVFGPAASPDGRKILFTAADTYSTRIYSIGVFPETPPDIVTHDGRDPSWSPTSRRIVFVLSEGPDATVATVGADGFGLRRFSATRGLDPDRPTWSPGGSHIAFISEPEGSAKLIVLNLRRGTLRVVARGVARQQPVWSPNGRRLYYTVPHTS